MKNVKSFKEIYIINEELEFKIIPTNLPITRFEIGLTDNYIDDKNNKTKAYYLIK